LLKAAQQSAPTTTAPLFDRIGGRPAIRATVDLFYDKMMADPRVNYFFEGVDMRAQRAHQAAFLTFALGGAKSYGGNGNMTQAHARLVREYGMTMEHFDVVLELIGASLIELEVPEDLIGEAAAVVETLRPAFQVAIDQES